MEVLGLEAHLVLGVGLQGEEDVAGGLPVGSLTEGQRLTDRCQVDVREDDVVPPAPGVVDRCVFLPENHFKFVCKNNILTAERKE